jgi:hypothetical protein
MKLSSGCDRQREDPDTSLGLDFHFENARLWIALGALAYTDDIADEQGSSHGAPLGGRCPFVYGKDSLFINRLGGAR